MLITVIELYLKTLCFLSSINFKTILILKLLENSASEKGNYKEDNNFILVD